MRDYQKVTPLGKVYEWGAVGSIIGTLLARFILITTRGTIVLTDDYAPVEHLLSP